MKYWVYKDARIMGPYDRDAVAGLPGLDAGTLVSVGDGAPSENGAQTTPAKRRRGTRGGRGRKRKPATGEAGAETGAATATVEEDGDAHEHDEPAHDAPIEEARDESQEESDPNWKYTPMSEWGDLDADNR